MKITIAILLLTLWAFKARAENVIYCSHPELCRMLNQISSDLKTESLVSITGDPHEYEPSTLEIKKLISAKVLVTGPDELNPWIKKIKFQRLKIPNLKTISLLFDQNDYRAYSHANGETISHFWLYPRIYCSLKNKLEAELIHSGFSIKTGKNCEFKKTEDQLRSVLLKIKKPIILTHDALLPLFLNLSPEPHSPIVAIKGSGHHSEANPESVKKMYNALSASQVIWVLEMGINIPQNIINKIRPHDLVIKIDTANSKTSDAFSVLRELTEKLSPYGEQ